MNVKTTFLVSIFSSCLYCPLESENCSNNSTPHEHTPFALLHTIQQNIQVIINHMHNLLSIPSSPQLIKEKHEIQFIRFLSFILFGKKTKMRGRIG